MAHLNNTFQSSNLAKIILEQEDFHKPQITLHNKKMRNNALTVTCLNDKNESPTLDITSISNQETEDHVMLIENKYPSTTNCEEFQRHENCDIRINQIENGKCLTIEEPNDSLSTKIIESGDRHLYKCLICQTSFSKITDFEYHSNRSYMCGICYVTFCTLTDLKCHTKLHNEIKSLKCHICKLKFTKESSLDKHFKDFHIGTIVSNPNLTTHIQTRNRSVKFDVCKSTFERKSLLQSHRCLKPYQVYECYVYEKELNQESDLKHHVSLHKDVNSEVEIPSNCQVTSLHQESLLKSNENVLNDEKPFVCETCHQCFSNTSSLLQHEKTHIDFEYKCYHCEKEFYEKSDLMCHMEYHYSKTENCPTCNQVFNDKSQFKSHKCLQQNKTYQCNICGKEFNEESDLKLHVILHKDENSKVEMPPNCQEKPLHQESLIKSNKNVLDDDKPFVCEICYQCFSNTSSLLLHEKTHKGIKYECYHCQKIFYKKSDLMCHMEYHSSKTKNCPTCNQVFNNKSQFKSHKCLHQDKIYQCNICEKEFNEESDLKHHVILHKDVNSKVEMPPNCQEKPLHQESLIKSNKNVLGDENPFICETCHQCFSKKPLLLRHKRTHIDIKYECYHCEKVFYKKSDLICHMENHYSLKLESCLTSNQMLNDKTQFRSQNCLSLNETYQCIICGEEFKYESDTELLMNYEYKDINSKIELIPDFRAISLHQEPLFESDKSVLSDEKLFKYGLCNQCSCIKLLVKQEKSYVDIKYKRDFLEKVFYQKLDTIFHMICHPFKTSEDYLSWNQVFNEKLLIQYLKYLKLEKIYQCSVCEEEFKHESHAKLHLNLHKDVNSKIEMTPDGQVTSLDQESLLNFKNSILGTVEKTFKCEYCYKLFPRESLLIWHETCHADIKKYYCQFCDKVVYQKSDLIFHMKSHAPKTTESCSICYREFKNKSFLNNHFKTIHDKVKSFTCHLCNDIVYSESKLINHLMAHTHKNIHACSLSFVMSHFEINTSEEFQCEICNTHFELKTLFDYHVENHCEDYLYPYDPCDNTKACQDENQFYKSKNTEETPLKCHICEMLFSHKDNLLEHLEKHYICVKPYISQIYSINYESEVKCLKQYQCDICKILILKKRKLIHHMKKHLKQKINFCNFRRIKCINNPSLKLTKNKNSIKCSTCTVIF